MANHIIHFPDCPKCGKEMREFMDEHLKSASDLDDFHTEWWVCDDCNYTVKIRKIIEKGQNSNE